MPEASLFERVGLEDISGPEISQMFEGFTPILTLDTEKHTYCI
jgi:hypothetical protein